MLLTAWNIDIANISDINKWHHIVKIIHISELLMLWILQINTCNHKTSSAEFLYCKFCNSVTNIRYNEWICLSHNNEKKTSGHESCNVHDFNLSWILHAATKLQACLIACLELLLDSLRVLTSSGVHYQSQRRSKRIDYQKHQHQKTWTVLPTPIMPQQRATNSSCKFGSKKSPTVTTPRFHHVTTWWNLGVMSSRDSNRDEGRRDLKFVLPTM